MKMDAPPYSSRDSTREGYAAQEAKKAAEQGFAVLLHQAHGSHWIRLNVQAKAE